ncbi:MAG: hypothetical protein J5I93_03170 [Pirellulaceae bacterium]|nr:hypothetical protein [Pirellulaceae bacterium]
MWQLSDNRARWTTIPLSFQIDVAHPASGLQVATIHELSVTSLRPLQLATLGEPRATRPELLECHVRGQDLVANYRESAAGRVSPEVYWRMNHPADDRCLAELEVILSLQTSRLDGHAEIQCRTELGAGELWHLAVDAHGEPAAAQQLSRHAAQRLSRHVALTLAEPGILLFRPDTLAWSYAEMVFPQDAGPVSLAPSSADPGWSVLDRRMLAEPMEKGVIRRGRLRAIWTARQSDQAAVLAAYGRFLASPPPLTV